MTNDETKRNETKRNVCTLVPGLEQPRLTRAQDFRTGVVREQAHWEWIGRDIAIERSLHPGVIHDQIHDEVHERGVTYSETGKPGGRPYK